MRRLRALAVRSLREFFADGCPQRAAAISYYALLSLFPLLILAVGALGLVFDRTSVREQVIRFVLERVPLRPGAGRADLRALLDGVSSHATGFGVIGALGLVFAASGVMGALRHGLNAAWDVDDPRPPLQGKLVDLLLVLGVGIAIAASFALSLAVRLTASFADTLSGWLGIDAPTTLLDALARLIPPVVSLLVCALLFRLVPARDTRLRDTWPGVLFAAAGFEAAKAGFSLYLQHFAHYDAIYASLGSIIAFIVFIWLAANVLLAGAEVASEWARQRRRTPDPQTVSPPAREQLRNTLRGLVTRRGPSAG